MNAQSQNNQILSYLKEGFSITPLEALERFGCLRLSARIADLKKKGYHIKTTYIGVGKRCSKKVASYSLETLED